MLTQRLYYVEFLDKARSSDDHLMIVGMNEFDSLDEVKAAVAEAEQTGNYVCRVWKREEVV